MPLIPKNDLSHWVGKAAHHKIPGPIGALAVQAFAKFYKINLDEAERPIGKYESIGDLFTRKLKSGARPIGAGIVHPCDGVITQAGVVSSGKCIQAKGKDYTVTELLRNHHWSDKFEGGTFITYYLCPTDYHRVHAPLTAKIPWSMHVPGELWPVNEWSVQSISNLFTTNERVSIVLEGASDASTGKSAGAHAGAHGGAGGVAGTAALVMVAATNVGNMTMSFDEHIVTNILEPERAAKERIYSPPRDIVKGDEVGVFHMGSTVIMLYENGMIKCDPAALIDRKVKMGEAVE